MKIRILSDLHIDVSKFSIKPIGEDLLILAGDISNKPEDTFNFIKKYIQQGLNLELELKVIFIMGNHDYYNDTIKDRLKYWKHFEQKLGPNFHFLHQNSIVLGDIEFYGTTLWSDVDISDVTDDKFFYYNDFNYIRKTGIYNKITPSDYSELYKQDLDKLTGFLDKETKFKRVIITHHLPSYKSVNEKYKDSYNNDLFASNLDDLILNHTEDIKLWIHGHTHSSVDYKIGNTRILCNPRGYIDENEEFKQDLMVEL